jgi:hypothetical protein
MTATLSAPQLRRIVGSIRQEIVRGGISAHADTAKLQDHVLALAEVVDQIVNAVEKLGGGK